ncbi:MAG TPA: alpha/beta hydrolase [Solirubrobacteraceae bacterium]|nr:alpha/beta hydrolase [Solirubrobacteraceae bacterium]
MAVWRARRSAGPARLLADLLAHGHTCGYGPHPSQVADLHLPRGAGPHPVAVVLHGGAWRARVGRAAMRGVVGELVRAGWAVWNVEYRRVGEGGGWPHTFADVADAVDHLRRLDAPLELDAVSAIGHSAGGHLALWAASRARLPAGSVGAQPAVSLVRAVAQAGVCDLGGAYERWHGGAVGELMGGSPQQLPERYAVADPLALAPAPAPVLLVHGAIDRVVPIELARRYAAASRAHGGEVELIEIEGAAGGHRRHVNPRSAAWRAAAAWLERAGAGAGERQRPAQAQ